MPLPATPPGITLPRFMSQNQVVNSKVYNSGTGRTNLRDPHPHKVWTGDGPIIFDLRSAVDVRAAILHAVKNVDAIRVQGNSSNAWTSPAIDVPMFPNDDDSTFVRFWNAAQSYQYWRFVIHPSSNRTPSIGVSFLGDYSSPEIGYFHDYSESRVELSEIGTAGSGSHFSSDRPTRQVWDVRWPVVKASERVMFNQLAQDVQIYKPFFVALGNQSAETNVKYVMLEEGLRTTYQGGFASVALSLVEVI